MVGAAARSGAQGLRLLGLHTRRTVNSDYLVSLSEHPLPLILPEELTSCVSKPSVRLFASFRSAPPDFEYEDLLRFGSPWRNFFMHLYTYLLREVC